jgi:hypothetical protein
MVKESKSKKSSMGSVGFFSSGIIKVGSIYIFSSTDNQPQEKYEEMRNYFGEYVQCKYVNCEDPDKVFSKLKKAIAENHNYGDCLYSLHSGPATTTLKEVSGASQCHSIKKKNPTKAKGKKSEDASGSEVDASGSDDEKQKKSTKKGKKAKASSDDDVESEDDSKKKKSAKKGKSDSDDEKSKKSSKKGKGKTDDSDDEKPKKKSSKKGKSKESDDESDKSGSENESGTDSDASKKAKKTKKSGKDEKKGKTKSK